VFQREVYAIKAYILENINKNYNNKNIYILSESQAVLNELCFFQIYSELACDCLQFLMTLVDQKKSQLIRVPGHEKMEGSGIADSLAKHRS
jgi:hypothetical protein